MNWLAHILLSRRDIEFQLGNFLADPLKGRVWEGASDSIRNGMLMHTAIDVFTDAHNIVSLSKSRLGRKGYLKGVVIDLLYDHYLASSWESYVDSHFEDFIDLFHTQSLNAAKIFPEQPRHIVTRLVESNRLKYYASFDGFIRVLTLVNGRLSPRIQQKDSLLNYITVVEKEYESLRSDFDRFFPELITLFKTHELGSQSDNYLA